MRYLGKIRRLLKEISALWSMTDFSTWLRHIWILLISLPSIVRDGDMQEARKKMFGRKYTFKVSGQTIILDGKYFGRATELYARRVYFSLPEFELRPGMVVFDLGANMGIFTVLAALIAKKVVAVEAVKEFIDEARENLKINNCLDKVSLVWGIIGEGSGMFANLQIRKKWLGENPPPATSIPELMKMAGVDKVDFMKIDIEGSEFDLFKNNEDWYRKVHYITMEAHNPFLSDGELIPTGDVQSVIRNLTAAGFEVKLLDLDGRVTDGIKGDAGYLFARNLAFS